MENCTKIIFSKRAYNSIVSETFDKIRTETGGILLGRIIDSIWYVIESIDPGPNSIFTITYFEYDTPYVNHLAKVISKEYETELGVLGLWHRHPGSMDTFSSTDNGTNTEFAKINSKGAISGLINIDPELRLTMYHVSFPLRYEKTNFEVGDHLFPEFLFNYKYAKTNRPPMPAQSVQNNSPIPKETTLFDTEQNKSMFGKIRGLIGRFKKNQLKANPKKDEVRYNINTGAKISISMPENNEEVIDDVSLERILKEEIILDENGYNYECETKDGRLLYTIKNNKDNETVNLQITFSVMVNTPNLVFQFDQNETQFSEGMFLKYINSCINKTEFIQ